jgi:two-component system response regulator BaeR
MKKNVLIVEDEQHIAEVLVAYAEQEGYQTLLKTSGRDVVQTVKEEKVDIILLDLMLPHVDGLTLCKQIRAFSNVPIIMVTAKGEEVDRLKGLDFGSDDYICKPFSPKEVMARIKAVLRRFQPEADNIIKQSGFELESDKYKVSLHQHVIDLTPIEFKILELLITHVERVYSRNEILNLVYSDVSEVSDRNIDTHIKNIRKKVHLVDQEANPIGSVYGVGYQFKAR